MRAQRTVRTLAAATLVGAGWALTRAARGVRQAADVVKPEPDADGDTDRREGPAGPVTAAQAGPLATDRIQPQAQTPPTVAVADGPSHVRTAETHVEELADKPAAEVIKAVDGLSTDELARLYEHEQDHKKRKTVLQAIEQALSPTG